MEKGNFLHSSILVLIAQIPLLLKLYFDYRSKKDIFRHDIHHRHMDAYENIAATMNELQSVQHEKVSLFCENVSDDEIMRSIRKSEGKAWTKWNSLIKEKELILPTLLVVMINEYKTTSAKTVGAGILTIRTVEELKTNWKKQTELYNDIYNYMRVMLGVDTLSKETLEMIQRNEKVSLVKTNYEIQ